MSAAEKAHRAEERRMRWLDRFPGNPLVHLLVFSPWFRWVLAAFLVLPVVGALMVPKLWVTSPPGVAPAVKVSILDLIQAWSLQRSATRLAAEGREQEAAKAWQMALANNRADIELVRASLRHALESDRTRKAAAANAMALIPWLLQLGNTNRADLALSARVCDHLDLPNQALALLKATSSEILSPEEEAVCLKSLFRTGRIREFGLRWDRSGQPLEDHAELGLYRAAYLAGWGQPGQLGPAADRLAQAAATPATELLASRLQLSVFGKLMDADGYGQALARLQRAHVDTLSDQVRYWNLLASLGRTATARELADAYVARFDSAEDVVQLAQAFVSLDMTDRARALLDHYGPQYGDSEDTWARELWLTYARLLIDLREWTTLEQLAVRLRALKHGGPALTGLSYLCEGRALIGQGLRDQAMTSLARVADSTFPSPEMAIQASRSLIEFGDPDSALKILVGLEAVSAKSAEYWRTVFEAVYAVRKDPAALANAARQAYELEPDNTLLMSNYAAALLISRQDADLALKLTLTVLGRLPNSLVAHVNRAFALILSQRFDEAEAVLNRLAPASLDARELTVYSLGLAEACAGRQQFQEVDRHLRSVEPGFLFPNQIERVEELKKQARAALEK